MIAAATVELDPEAPSCRRIVLGGIPDGRPMRRQAPWTT
jgi:hypothetical protein